jgi:predicted NBD/HSP70 family sugar kinase
MGAGRAVAEEWGMLDVQSELELATKLPVQVMNDGNAACWAELVLRPRPRPDDFAYIFVGRFIGGGLVAEGLLMEGVTGKSADLGSILVSDGQGGRQFGHLIASLHALEQRLLSTDHTPLPKRDPREWDWGELGPVGEQWLSDAATAFAEIINSTAAVSEIKLAILDGTLPPEILKRLISMTEGRLEDIGSLTSEPPQIAQGHVGSLAAALGAAYRPLYRKYFSRGVDHLTEDAG